MINFVRGFIIGIIMALPAGPLAILVLKRSLTKGYKIGLATALGVALADGFYALVAGLGLTAVSGFVLGRKEYFFMGGGLLLILLGVRTLKKPPTIETDVSKQHGFIPTLIQTMLITLTNPMTLLMFIAAFTAAGFEGQEEALSQVVLICLGVFVGSMSWFAIISIVSASQRKRVTPYALKFITTISGALLICFGIVFLVHAAWELLAKVY